MSSPIERMETPENLKALHEFYPEAKTVAGGIHHMMVDQGRSILTVVRMIETYGGTISSSQIEQYRKVAKISKPLHTMERDYDELCSRCGLQPRDHHFMCNNCFNRASTDVPAQQVSIGNPNTGRATWTT